ncbi:MAG: radical SAM protein [Candidatus Thorarchaeota archaeon]|nr:radical SAM protein [Candidatus Thorarchaeota archaeon]
MKVRVSLGSAIELGLVAGNPIPHFTTLFLMTFKKGRCNANCAFCPQAKESTSSSDRLSRISWPIFDLKQVASRLGNENGFVRICIQSLNYPDSLSHVVEIIGELRRTTDLPISVSIHPLKRSELLQLKQAGASNIGVAFDACTPAVFDRVKGADRGDLYRWEWHVAALLEAKAVFGKGNVTTHLMIGLGESEVEATEFLFLMKEMDVNVGLFAFTNIRGTALEHQCGPSLESYRRVQVVRYLVERGLLNKEQVIEQENGSIRLSIPESDISTYLSSGKAFEVTGCSGCNRPFYNERPAGTLYNFPCPQSKDEIQKAIQESGLVR